MKSLVLHDAALADGRSQHMTLGVSMRVQDGRIAWIRPADDADLSDAEVVDAGGATIVPAMVDGHSHLTLQGGSHWLERGSDPPAVLMQVARDNARRLVQAGVLWARDVGAPRVNGRALSLAVRDELDGKPGQPYIRVAGTWLAKTGWPPLLITVDDGTELAAAAVAQLDQGTDLVKLYLDSPGGSTEAPFGVDDVCGMVDAVHARGARVAAHATYLAGVRVGAEAGVDTIEHGMEIDDDTARVMAERGVALVSTLSVFASWETFAATTRIERFTSDEARRRMAKRREGAYAAVAAARRAGVRIATGSDFGGGSVRAGHLAWEVELLVGAGLEPHEALAAATWRGGEVLGIDHAGRIEEGMPADLVLVHGDPLSDPRALWRVWAVYQRGVRVA
ncbi:MAG: amidohydrolase family protein [Candidatus Limnocylindria bacterium]